ncbi:MAG: regulatory protein RecX [Spirochaetaceae bacterium]
MQVDSIDQRGTTGGRACVSFADGSSFFVSAELVAGLELAPGVECSEETIEQLRHAHLLLEAREQALELLARREHSRFLLARKLLLRQFGNDVVEPCLDRLSAEGLLDDRRFAEQWVISRVRRRPEGEHALVAGLQARGVHGDTAREVVEAFRREYPEEMDRALERAGGRICRQFGGDPGIVREKLHRRGFRRDEIDRYVERISVDEPK